MANDTETMTANHTAGDDVVERFSLNWSADAPRGGRRAVLTRILKDSATVPWHFDIG
jgi:hypothetical protein